MESQRRSLEAVYRSLTPAELEDPDLRVDPLRLGRIAARSGITVEQAQGVLAQFYAIRELESAVR